MSPKKACPQVKKTPRVISDDRGPWATVFDHVYEQDVELESQLGQAAAGALMKRLDQFGVAGCRFLCHITDHAARIRGDRLLAWARAVEKATLDMGDMP